MTQTEKITGQTSAENGINGPVDGVHTIEAVRRALSVLRCFSVDNAELGVTDIARMLDMHKSTVHRILVTMEREGFIYQVENGRYALSFTLLEISAGVGAWQGTQEAVLSALKDLVRETGETAHLAVLDAGEVLYVEKKEGTWSLRMPSAVGKRVPLNCTALGKVLLAGLDPAEARRIIYGTRWSARTDNSITDPVQLERAVDLVRGRGYAFDEEEIEQGLLCIAAPVVDDLGMTCAGVSIAAPMSRVLPQLDEHVRSVRTVCDQLSATLGARARQLRRAAHA